MTRATVSPPSITLQNHARNQADRQGKQRSLQRGWSWQAHTASSALTTTLRRSIQRTYNERNGIL